jgi:hypothetical protein
MSQEALPLKLSLRLSKLWDALPFRAPYCAAAWDMFTERRYTHEDTGSSTVSSTDKRLQKVIYSRNILLAYGKGDAETSALPKLGTKTGLHNLLVWTPCL